MYKVDYERLKSKIITIISFSGGLPFTRIYEIALSYLKNHFLVKSFLIGEGYTDREIARAKHNSKLKGIK